MLHKTFWLTLSFFDVLSLNRKSSSNGKTNNGNFAIRLMRESLSPLSALYLLFGKWPEFGIGYFINLWTVRPSMVILEEQQNLGGNKHVCFKQRTLCIWQMSRKKFTLCLCSASTWFLIMSCHACGHFRVWMSLIWLETLIFLCPIMLTFSHISPMDLVKPENDTSLLKSSFAPWKQPERRFYSLVTNAGWKPQKEHKDLIKIFH